MIAAKNIKGVTMDEEIENLQLDKPGRGKSLNEIQKHTLDPLLDNKPIEKSLLILMKGDEIQKISVIENLPKLLQTDYDGTVKKLLPKIQLELINSSLELHIVASKAFQYLLENKVSVDILHSIFQGIDSRDPIISSTWLDTLIFGIPYLPGPVIRSQLLPYTISFSKLNKPLVFRISSCRIIGQIASHPEVTPNEIKKDILPLVASLCQDCQYEVRAIMCSQLTLISKGLAGDPVVKSVLLPILVELCADENLSVQIASIEVVVSVIPFLPEDALPETIIPLVKTVCVKANEELSSTYTTIARGYGKLLSSLQSYLSQIDCVWFLQNYKTLSRWGLGKNMDFNRDTNSNLEAQCRESCAYNLPALTYFMVNYCPNQIENWYSVFKNLAADPCFFVRKTVASSLHEILKLVGFQSSFIKEDIINLIRDNSEEVLESLVPHLGEILEYLAQFNVISREMVTNKSLDVARSLVKCQIEIFTTLNWRIQALFLKQFEHLPNCFTSDVIHQHFTPVLFNITIEARTRPVRSQAIRTLLILLRYNLKEVNRKWIRDNFHSRIHSSKSCYIRVLYVDLCNHAMAIFSNRYFKEFFYLPLLALLDDPVSNIRCTVTGMAPTMKRMLNMPPDRLLQNCLDQGLAKMGQNEHDRDVLGILRIKLKEMVNIPPLKPNELAEEKRRTDEEDKIAAGKIATVEFAGVNVKKPTQSTSQRRQSTAPGKSATHITSSSDISFLPQHFIIDAGVNPPENMTNFRGKVLENVPYENFNEDISKLNLVSIQYLMKKNNSHQGEDIQYQYQDEVDSCRPDSVADQNVSKHSIGTENILNFGFTPFNSNFTIGKDMQNHKEMFDKSVLINNQSLPQETVSKPLASSENIAENVSNLELEYMVEQMNSQSTDSLDIEDYFQEISKLDFSASSSEKSSPEQNMLNPSAPPEISAENSQLNETKLKNNADITSYYKDIAKLDVTVNNEKKSEENDLSKSLTSYETSSGSDASNNIQYMLDQRNSKLRDSLDIEDYFKDISKLEFGTPMHRSYIPKQNISKQPTFKNGYASNLGIHSLNGIKYMPQGNTNLRGNLQIENYYKDIAKLEINESSRKYLPKPSFGYYSDNAFNKNSSYEIKQRDTSNIREGEMENKSKLSNNIENVSENDQKKGLHPSNIVKYRSGSNIKPRDAISGEYCEDIKSKSSDRSSKSVQNVVLNPEQIYPDGLKIEDFNDTPTEEQPISIPSTSFENPPKNFGCNQENSSVKLKDSLNLDEFKFDEQNMIKPLSTFGKPIKNLTNIKHGPDETQFTKIRDRDSENYDQENILKPPTNFESSDSNISNKPQIMIKPLSTFGKSTPNFGFNPSNIKYGPEQVNPKLRNSLDIEDFEGAKLEHSMSKPSNRFGNSTKNTPNFGLTPTKGILRNSKEIEQFDEQSIAKPSNSDESRGKNVSNCEFLSSNNIKYRPEESSSKVNDIEIEKFEGTQFEEQSMVDPLTYIDSPTKNMLGLRPTTNYIKYRPENNSKLTGDVEIDEYYKEIAKLDLSKKYLPKQNIPKPSNSFKNSIDNISKISCYSYRPGHSNSDADDYYYKDITILDSSKKYLPKQEMSKPMTTFGHYSANTQSTNNIKYIPKQNYSKLRDENTYLSEQNLSKPSSSFGNYTENDSNLGLDPLTNFGYSPEQSTLKLRSKKDIEGYYKDIAKLDISTLYNKRHSSKQTMLKSSTSFENHSGNVSELNISKMRNSLDIDDFLEDITKLDLSVSSSIKYLAEQSMAKPSTSHQNSSKSEHLSDENKIGKISSSKKSKFLCHLSSDDMNISTISVENTNVSELSESDLKKLENTTTNITDDVKVNIKKISKLRPVKNRTQSPTESLLRKVQKRFSNVFHSDQIKKTDIESDRRSLNEKSKIPSFSRTPPKCITPVNVHKKSKPKGDIKSANKPKIKSAKVKTLSTGNSDDKKLVPPKEMDVESRPKSKLGFIFMKSSKASKAVKETDTHNLDDYEVKDSGSKNKCNIPKTHQKIAKSHKSKDEFMENTQIENLEAKKQRSVPKVTHNEVLINKNAERLEGNIQSKEIQVNKVKNIYQLPKSSYTDTAYKNEEANYHKDLNDIHVKNTYHLPKSSHVVDQAYKHEESYTQNKDVIKNAYHLPKPSHIVDQTQKYEDRNKKLHPPKTTQNAATISDMKYNVPKSIKNIPTGVGTDKKYVQKVQYTDASIKNKFHVPKTRIAVSKEIKEKYSSSVGNVQYNDVKNKCYVPKSIPNVGLSKESKDKFMGNVQVKDVDVKNKGSINKFSGLPLPVRRTQAKK